MSFRMLTRNVRIRSPVEITAPVRRLVVFGGRARIWRGAFFVHAHNAQARAGLFIDIDERAAQAHLAIGDRKDRGHIGNKAPHDRIDGAAENRIGRAAHARVAEESRAAGKDLFVRGLHMRVRADDGGNFPIEKTAERNFLARRLAMRIDQNDVRFRAHLRDRGFHCWKWIFENRLHECARLHVDHADFALRRFEHDRPAPGVPAG